MREADDATIRKMIDDQMAAWNGGDAEGYASTAGDDVGFTNIRGHRFVGREAFVAVHRRILGGIYAGSNLDAEVERITFPGDRVAVVELVVRLTGAKAMPPGIVADAEGVLRARLLEVFELRDATWTLVAFHNTAVLA